MVQRAYTALNRNCGPRSARPAGADETGLVGEDDELRAVPGAELGHRPADVGARRRGAEWMMAYGGSPGPLLVTLVEDRNLTGTIEPL